MKQRLLLPFFALIMASVVHAQSDSITIETVGLIGSATPMGWDADTTMTQDSADAHLWTITITLAVGEAKFRANDDWDINWGTPAFPYGIGTQGGDNIQVLLAGDYLVSLHDSTGEYYFENLNSNVGIIGEAAPFGWDRDVNMLPDTTDGNRFHITLPLDQGPVKFRQDDDWVVNWGNPDSFPTGIGAQDLDNIMVPKAGTYFITLDSASGAYAFEEIITFASVGLIGDATANGWDSTTALVQDSGDPNSWGANITLDSGGVQFTANDGEFIWGGDGWPSDTAMIDGDTIPAAAGEYKVSFNTETGVYDFSEIVIYESIGIIGTAVSETGFEGDDTDLLRSANDSSLWTLRAELMDGEAKFRANDDWTVSWGSGDFPSGIGTTSFGPNIPVTAGEYLIQFNSITGEYSFEEIVEYDAIGLVGRSSPAGDWPLPADEDDGSRDAYLTVSPDNPQSWSLENVTVGNAADFDDGGVKFRADTSWTVNWGAADFPSGIGTQDGDNIVTVAGTFDVTFNSATGEYAFTEPGTTANKDLLKPSAIEVFPNPATSRLQIDLSALILSDDLTIRVFDLAGKLLSTQERAAQKLVSIDVSQFATGNYLLQISSKQLIVGKKFTVVR